MHINRKKGVFDRIKCANSAKCCTYYCGRSVKLTNKEEMQLAFGNSLTLDSTKFAKYRQVVSSSVHMYASVSVCVCVCVCA